MTGTCSKGRVRKARPVHFRYLKFLREIVRSGNEGWIGVSPKGDDYHVVVPVDVQIARGVVACNRPTDGTPFGGYVGWLYFRCPPYPDEGGDESFLRDEQIRNTSEQLIRWLASYDIEAVMEAGSPM